MIDFDSKKFRNGIHTITILTSTGLRLSFEVDYDDYSHFRQLVQYADDLNLVGVDEDSVSINVDVLITLFK